MGVKVEEKIVVFFVVLVSEKFSLLFMGRKTKNLTCNVRAGTFW